MPPATVRDIADVLSQAGHEVWCVGGAVRDALLGEPHLDWDLATSATPDVVRRLFRRTVPLGIEFGTVGVLDAAGTMHEVTTFRRDVQTDGRHAVVAFGVSLEDDLARRDFTINAIAVSPDGRRLADPFDGRGDLSRRVLRAVGEPSARMTEDRLRALRALRFAARFDFTIAADTWTAIAASAPHLGRLSAERVKQEIEKTLEQVTQPSRAFRLWRAAEAFAVVAPALAGVADAEWQAVDRVPRAPRGATPARRARRRLERLAVMCAGLDPRAAGAMLKALRFSNADQGWVLRIIAGVAAHRDAIARAVGGDMPVADQRRVARHIAHDAGRLDATTVVRVALVRAERPGDVALVRAFYRVVRDAARHDPVAIGDLAIDGDDLRGLGAHGPAMGQVLRALLAEVLEEPARNARAMLLDRAAALLAAQAPRAEGSHASA
ncbi:MAG: hypothetical protein MUE41_13500 [Gemmatimonadaceae bacterium]|nr:hypothetical protein [Gemmatimonadaceae bacterium]